MSVTGGSLNTDIGPDSEAHITPNEADDMEPDRLNTDEKMPENRLAFVVDVDEKNGKLEAKTNTAVWMVDRMIWGVESLFKNYSILSLINYL